MHSRDSYLTGAPLAVEAATAAAADVYVR